MRFQRTEGFCYDNDCGICDDIYDDESKDDYINEHLSDMADDADSWQSLYRTLDDIPTGYDYYRLDDYGEFNGLGDDDFEDYKDEVLEWMDDNEYWDEDEDDEEEYFLRKMNTAKGKTMRSHMKKICSLSMSFSAYAVSSSE